MTRAARIGATLAALPSLLGGCAAPRERDCGADRCEAIGSREDLLAALSGFEDPVATFLRQAAGERGTLTGDYRDLLEGVGTVLGCAVETARGRIRPSRASCSELDTVPKTKAIAPPSRSCNAGVPPR